MTDGNGQTQWSPFTGSNGWTYTDKNPWGTKFNYGDEKFNETMTWFRSLSEKGYSPTLDKTVGADTGKLLAAGAYATVIEGDWNTSGFMKKGANMAIAPTPIGPSGKRASMFNGLADSVNAATKNRPPPVKWVEFTGSAECQNLVAEKAVVFPAIPESTEKAEAAFKAAGVDMSGFLIHIKDKTTFLFPITDHAADVTRHHGAGAAGVHARRRRVRPHRGKHAGQRPVQLVGRPTCIDRIDSVPGGMSHTRWAPSRVARRSNPAG